MLCIFLSKKKYLYRLTGNVHDTLSNEKKQVQTINTGNNSSGSQGTTLSETSNKIPFI